MQKSSGTVSGVVHGAMRGSGDQCHLAQVENSVSKRVSVMDNTLNSMDDVTGGIETAVHALRERLRPVLSPAPDVKGLQGASVQQIRCDVVTRIENHTDILGAILALLNEIEGSLEI